MACYPLQNVDWNAVGDTQTQFISDYGVPECLTFDKASVQTGPKTRFMLDAIRRYRNVNPAEQGIHKLKKRWLVLVDAQKENATSPLGLRLHLGM